MIEQATSVSCRIAFPGGFQEEAGWVSIFEGWLRNSASGTHARVWIR